MLQLIVKKVIDVLKSAEEQTASNTNKFLLKEIIRKCKDLTLSFNQKKLVFFSTNSSRRCRFCNQVFATLNDLVQHTDKSHTDQSQLKCFQCEQTFKWVNNTLALSLKSKIEFTVFIKMPL